MKLITKEKFFDFIDYVYKDNIRKRAFNNGQIIWTKYNFINKEDGAAITNYDNNHNRKFYLSSLNLLPHEFAYNTNHIICDICDDFCNQECFL